MTLAGGQLHTPGPAPATVSSVKRPRYQGRRRDNSRHSSKAGKPTSAVPMKNNA